MGLARLLTIVGILVLIPLMTTAGSLALQASFGRSPALILGALIVTGIAAAAFALWGLRRV